MFLPCWSFVLRLEFLDMKTKMRKKSARKGSASVEVLLSIAVFMVLAITAFWISARVYAAIYGINAISAGAGLSTIVFR